MLIEPKTVPIILKLCQHNWEEPIHSTYPKTSSQQRSSEPHLYGIGSMSIIHEIVRLKGKDHP